MFAKRRLVPLDATFLQQFGRYHKESDASDDEPAAETKKSVRFEEYDPREEWQAFQSG